MLDDGDEMFVLMFDYLFWMVVVNLLGGIVIYYKCDEENFWYFDIIDMESKIILCICGIVIINLNNLIGVVYLCYVFE